MALPTSMLGGRGFAEGRTQRWLSDGMLHVGVHTTTDKQSWWPSDLTTADSAICLDSSRRHQSSVQALQRLLMGEELRVALMRCTLVS